MYVADSGLGAVEIYPKGYGAVAATATVGKSLTAHGGQNPIEPGALGKAMVFGPNMENFADVVLSFLAHDGAVQVRDAAELEKALGDLLADPSRREQIGRNAIKVVEQNLGAVDRTVQMIVDGLDNGAVYIAPKRGIEPLQL